MIGLIYLPHSNRQVGVGTYTGIRESSNIVDGLILNGER